MKKPELVERQIRLPLDTTNRLEEMGAQGGLTGEQMLQAILILDLFQNGWIKLTTPNPKPETHGCMECGAEIPCDRTWCGHCQNFDEIPSE